MYMEIKLRIRYFWRSKFSIHSYNLHNTLYQLSLPPWYQESRLEKKWGKMLVLCKIRTPLLIKFWLKKVRVIHVTLWEYLTWEYPEKNLQIYYIRIYSTTVKHAILLCYKRNSLYPSSWQHLIKSWGMKITSL